MNYSNRTLLTIIVLLGLLSCEKEADVTLGNGIPTLVVDAFINDLDQEQQIFLFYSQDFFENTPYEPFSGATVRLSNDADSAPIEFTERPSQAGLYTWTPSDDQTIGPIGTNYTLQIIREGMIYEAKAKLHRTTAVDSILFYEEEGIFGGDDFIEARFYGRDPEGTGDQYWIKTFRNNIFLGNPGEINIAYDAGFTEGAQLDGISFIPPIRSGINPEQIDDDEDLTEQFSLGDTVRVEIHSITRETFDFMQLLAIQTDRPGGFAELFANPLANIPSNVYLLEGNENNPIAHRVLGQFSISAVESKEVIFTEELIRQD